MEITFDGNKVVTAHVNGHIIRTDQPLDNGGGDSAPAPFDLYLAAIGTCAGIYVKSFCDKRNIPTEGIKIFQKTEFSETTDLPVNLTIEIQLPPDFPEKYKASVISAAELCKVKKSIASPPSFQIITSNF